MKSLICSLVFILMISGSYAQWPVTQSLGNANTLVNVPPNGGLKANLVNRTYSDTTSANLGNSDFYGGAMIYTSDCSCLWFRDSARTKWVQILPSGAPIPGGQGWLVGGNTWVNDVDDLTFGVSSQNRILFKTTDITRIILDSAGIVRSSGAANKFLVIDTVTKLLYYTDGGSSSSGWSLTGNAGTTAGTNFIGTTDAQDLVFKRNSLNSGLIGSVNTAFGYQSLLANTTGEDNVAIGHYSLSANLSGIGNVVVGVTSLNSNTTGGNNTAVGNSTLAQNNGSGNTAFGNSALSNNATGDNNTGIGNASLSSLSSGSGNIALGLTAGAFLTSQSDRLIINSLNRANILGDTTKSIIYGAQDATAANQRLYFNSRVFAPYMPSGVGTKSVRINPGTGELTYADTASGSGSQTFQQTLTAGSTLTGDNTVTNTGHTFKISNATERLSLADSAWRIGNNLSYVKSNNVGNKTHVYTSQTSSDFTTFLPLAGKPSDGELAYMTSWPFVEISDSATLANPTGYLKGLDIVGVWDSTTFPGSSLPSGWANFVITPTISDGATFTGNGGGITDGFTYSTKYSSSLNYKTTVYFTLNTKPATFTDGFYVGRRSANTSQQTQNAIIARYSDANNWRLVTNVLYGSTTTNVDSTGTIPMANGNKYKIEVSGSNTNLYVKFTLLTTGGLDSVTAAVNYKYLTAASDYLQPANLGSDWMSGLGSTGSYKVTSISTTHYENKQVDVLFLGNSVGTRYDATSVMNHYTTLSMSGNNKSWANLAGGGDRLTDMNLERDAIVQIKPKYAIIEAGINDAAGDIRTQLNKLIDTLQANNIIPVLLKLFSVTAKDSVVFNVCREQGVKLVDANRPNQPLSTTDGAHATDLGNQQIVYYLRSECPEIFGSTGGRELYTLNGMGDVLNTSLSNNDVLKWNSTSKKWVNGTTSPVAGADTYVQYNNSGALAGTSGLKFDYTNDRLGVGLGVASPQTSVETNGTFRTTGFNNPSSGSGIEMFYFGGGGYGQIRAYNWTGSAYLPITIGNNEIYTTGGGLVGINDATPSAALDVNGTFNTSGVNTLANLAGTGSRTVLADAGGVLSAPVSDRSTKQNILPLDYGLNTLMKLRPVSFEYKKDWQRYGTGKQIGFIAQEVKEVLPNSTFTTPSTGKMGYNEIDIVPVLVKAMQEQQQQIEELKREIIKLQNK